MTMPRENASPKDNRADQVKITGQDGLSAEAKELAKVKDRHLRLAADFENFRKRTARETERRAAAQKEAFIHDLLPVIDNLERALDSGNASASPEQLRPGVQLTLQQLHQLLQRHGIEPEESLGRPFDPHRQEALFSRRDPAQPDHTVLEVSQRGYRRGQEVFRPAKVVVNDLSQPASGPEAAANIAPASQPSHPPGGKSA
ncbi:MAG: nucleotide exchange factor GrpE [Verrucomicrobiota bacterium]